MVTEVQVSIEKALAKTEADANTTLKAAQTVANAIRKMRAASHTGNLKDLSLTIDAAEKAIEILKQQFVNTRIGWDFPQESYLSDGTYVKELLATGEQMGVRIFERDDRLFCYPSIIRILPAERSALIDKTKIKNLRPTVLVDYLKRIQRKPPSFRPETFMEALYKAYEKVVATRQKDSLGSEPVVALLELYELFTLLPGQSKEYSKHEFARDIYLLDKSDIKTTKNDNKMALHPPRNKFDRKAIGIIKEDGEEIYYRSISFTLQQGVI